MTFKEYFEKETNTKMSSYIERFVDKNIYKYGVNVTSEAFKIAINKHMNKKFETPVGFTKYFNAVCRNLSHHVSWEEL